MDLYKFADARKADEDYTAKCIEILKARGQIAGWPKGVALPEQS